MQTKALNPRNQQLVCCDKTNEAHDKKKQTNELAMTHSGSCRKIKTHEESLHIDLLNNTLAVVAQLKSSTTLQQFVQTTDMAKQTKFSFFISLDC